MNLNKEFKNKHRFFTQKNKKRGELERGVNVVFLPLSLGLILGRVTVAMEEVFRLPLAVAVEFFFLLNNGTLLFFTWIGDKGRSATEETSLDV